MAHRTERDRRRLTDAALLLATAAGFLLATWQALAPDLGAADQAAAVVNGVVISQADLARAVEAIAGDKRNPLTAADRARALDTLITEELLIQRAEQIGLLQSDRMVRSAVVDAMVQAIVSREQAAAPDEQTLRRFYDEHPLLGAEAVRVQLVHAARPWPATATVTALRQGQAFESVFAPAALTPLPPGWLRMDALTTYLPGGVLQSLPGLVPGDIAGPIRIGEQAHFVWLQDKQPGQRPPFEALRDQVLVAWQARHQERAVIDTVARLRASAEIQTPS